LPRKEYRPQVEKPERLEKVDFVERVELAHLYDPTAAQVAAMHT